MDYFDVVKQRRSVRAFRRESPAPDQLQAILEAANLAPSAGDLQAYEIYVVERSATTAALARAAGGQEFVAQAPVVLVFCAHPARSAPRYGKRGEQLYAVQDATIACTFAMLAATAAGLASVWVGAFDPRATRRAIGAPAPLTPVAVLPVGAAAERPAAAPRRPLEDIVHSPAPA